MTRFQVCETPTLVGTDDDPVPEGAVVAWYEGRDGVRSRVARWCPPGALRGTVVLLNGRAEFIEKYFEVIGDLIRRRFAVVTFDWRGQGLSDRLLRDRNKGHVDVFDDYLHDLGGIIDGFVVPQCPRPYTLMSHSMGGCAALSYLARTPGTFASAIFSAPMWGVGKSVRTPGWMRMLALALDALGAGRLYLPGRGAFSADDRLFGRNVLTHDPERFERFIAQITAEPGLGLGGPTVRWLRASIRAIEALHAPGHLERIEIPVRICTPLDDRLVSVATQVEIAARLPNARLIEVPGAWHEILVERDDLRHRFWQAFDEL
jgi:lysophospholipase